MSDFSVDKGHEVLDDVLHAYSKVKLNEANEAETRIRVIDRVLFEVLGWKLDDINVEVRVSEDGNTTFADYLISTPSVMMIIEAKKAGAAFTLPSNHKKAKLGGALSKGDLGDAIRQARDYCRKLSIGFAVVTNGSAWIVFPVNRTDGVSFEDTEALIFKSLSDIDNRFVEFWELLSRQRVIEGNLANELLGLRRQFSHRKVISLLDQPGFRLGRNSVYDLIEPAVIETLTDEAILNDAEALKACYVTTSERQKYDRRLKYHVVNIRAHLGHRTIRARSRKGASVMRTHIVESNSHVIRLLLILGAVGVGKTTFIHHTRKVSSIEDITGKILWFHIDFKRATMHDNPRIFIYKELLELIQADEEFDLGDWDRSIRPAYSDRIRNLERGPLSLLRKSNPAKFDEEITRIVMADHEATEPYVEKLLLHATGKRPGFMVIDNVDQIESDDRQSEIFSEAQTAAKRMNLNLLMSIRDSTFMRHRHTATFNAFQHDSLFIDPPSVNAVLSKRFGYAKLVLKGKSAQLVTDSGIRFDVPDLSLFFEIVSNSLLTSETAYLIEILSGGNIRRGLSLVREFLSSGHTSSDKALESYLLNGTFTFPKHEIFKSIILGQRKYYREEDSLIPNIFNSKAATPNLQLLRLSILNRLVSRSISQADEGTSIAELESELAVLGVPAVDVQLAISTLVQAQALHTVDGGKLTNNSIIHTTRFSAYLVNELVGYFPYVEMCLIDTNIQDDAVWSKLEMATRAIESCQDGYKKLELRIERMRVFIQYLIRQEESWIVECRRRYLDASWSEPIIRERVTKLLEDEFALALRSAFLY